MQNRTKNTIFKNAQLTRQLIRHHFPKKSVSIKPLVGGLTNFVYEVNVGREKLVVRLSDKAEKIQFFQKEQWAVARAKEKGIPVPEILEVGNDIIPVPYMISGKIEGEEATHHKCRLDIIKETGRYASLVHSIATNGYGHIFDWSPNTLSKNDTWQNYLDNELKVDERLGTLKKNKMISPKVAANMTSGLKDIRQWNQKPCLHHGDLRLKNMIVDPQGKITAIIDWENCISSIGPGWDTSIALHDLSIEAQWRYLEGYGITDKKLLEIAPAIKIFNLLNYAPAIETIIRKKQKNKLDHYRIRLKGVLDLFSM